MTLGGLIKSFFSKHATAFVEVDTFYAFFLDLRSAVETREPPLNPP